MDTNIELFLWHDGETGPRKQAYYYVCPSTVSRYFNIHRVCRIKYRFNIKKFEIYWTHMKPVVSETVNMLVVKYLSGNIHLEIATKTITSVYFSNIRLDYYIN